MRLQLINYILILLWTHNTIQSLISEQTIDFIYSPFYLKKYDITDPQGASTKIQVAEAANLIFVSAGYAGIIIIDGTTNDIIFEQSANEFLRTVAATSDGKFVMFSHNFQFSIFEFRDRKSLILLGYSDFPSIINDIILDTTEETAYVFGLKGQLIAFDISDKDHLKQIGSHYASANIKHTNFLSANNKWILFGDITYGISVLRIDTDPLTRNQTFILAGKGAGIWKMWASVMTSDLKYVYALDNWNGIYFFDFSVILNSDESNYPVAIQISTYWPFTEINPSVYSLTLTKDDNYLLVGVRSKGIYIFNIKDRINPVYFQGISVEAHAFSVALSKNQEYLYFANAVSIYVFSSVELNLNDDYPNLFNTHQGNSTQLSSAYYKWRCSVKEIDSKYIYFGAYDLQGLYFFDVTDPYNIQQIYHKKYVYTSLIDSIAFTSDLKYIYITVAEDTTAVQVLDISNVSNPVEVFRFQIENPLHSEQSFFSKDKKYYVIAESDGILLLDTSQKPSMMFLDYWKINSSLVGQNVCGVMISNDNKWIIGTIRDFGIFLLDASVKTSLVFVDSLQTLGAEGIVPSDYSNDYAFLYDGFKGIALLDLTVLPKLKILSRLLLEGWANQIIPIKNDEFIFVVQLEAGMITLVDISNKSSLKIISNYQYQQQSGQSLCITPDSRYIFINNNLGVIVLPIISQVNIHTEIQQVITAIDGTETVNRIAKGQNLKVGQVINFNFVPIYPKEGMQIISVTFYDKQQIKSLPFWMSYYSNKQSLVLSVDKSGLSDDHTQTNLNTVILKSVLPIYATDFVFSDPLTNIGQATLIFEYLQEKKILDFNGLITDYFEPTEAMSFEITGVDSSQRLFDLVKLTLQRAVYYNPVIFDIEPSLTLDISDSTEPISTLALSIQMYLAINESDGKFVAKDYSGVIVSMSDKQDQLKLEGALTDINRALTGKIILANKVKVETIQVKITVVDNVNYQISQYYAVSDCVFITLKKQLILSPDLTLQLQFNKSYDSAQINIQEDFSMDFSPNTFQVEDSTSLTYTVTLLQDNSYSSIPVDYWLQSKVASGSLNFNGYPPLSSFNSIQHVRVVASDGYTTAQDEFIINPAGLPLIYILNLGIKIFGPIFAVLGVYKYKSQLMNIVFQKKVSYSPEFVKRGQLYQKQLALLGDDIQKCQLLFKGLLNSFLIRQDKIVSENQIPQKSSQYIDPIQSSNRNKSISFGVHHNRLRRLKVIQPIKRAYQLDFYLKSLQQIPNYERNSELELLYLKKDGDINMKKLLKDIRYKNITFTLNNEKYQANHFLTDFKNETSKIYKGIQAQAARYFLRQDTRSFEVYNYLQAYSKNLKQFTPNDWYQALVNIEATTENDVYGFPIPFPKLALKEDVLNKILIDLQLHNELGKPFSTLEENGINYHLIREVIFADTLGLVDYIPSEIFPCIGESIHLHPYEIGSLEAFKKKKDSRFKGIRKLLNIDYVNYGVSKNMVIPNWIQLNIKNGVITLDGTPQSQDVEELLIRITHTNEFVIKQYQFQVVDEFVDNDSQMGELETFPPERNQKMETKKQETEKSNLLINGELENQKQEIAFQSIIQTFHGEKQEGEQSNQNNQYPQSPNEKNSSIKELESYNDAIQNIPLSPFNQVFNLMNQNTPNKLSISALNSPDSNSNNIFSIGQTSKMTLEQINSSRQFLSKDG